ncbi:hypothetical protein HUB98_27325 [Paenibacillus barcinonensis]|uniref:Uncharacterized protein n=1 Tax=Paenibacillus barcinonensis TaxID=198119 RepID=A0A2V4VET0_PAEBA|nr:hypothetical protein [Paenibacillus barcinonensis]PYE52330.1 hypothetical protein DFQ00_101263 [Paenibacillus barcinonensis]QKS59551.1 hypothetical protein HUB98_27325 [Paenibacillus barcinonensis]
MKSDVALKQSRIQKCIYVFLSVMLGFAAFSFWPTAYAAAPTSNLAPAAVEQYAEQQAQALGTSNIDWLAARLDYYPLGPGTHGWYVQASIQNKRIGYMIISVTSDGQLTLTEYGQGEQALYDNELLGQALERLHLKQTTVLAAGGEITARYAPPLLAYWKLERPNQEALYLDAANGDLLPANTLQRLERDAHVQSGGLAELLKPQVMSTVKPGRTSTVHKHPAFDPSIQLAWLTSEPLQPAHIQRWLQYNQREALVFSAGERNLFYGGPLPVSGHQLWHTGDINAMDPEESDSVLYVALGGIYSVQRFVSLHTLWNDGHFYILNP